MEKFSNYFEYLRKSRCMDILISYFRKDHLGQILDTIVENKKNDKVIDEIMLNVA